MTNKMHLKLERLQEEMNHFFDGFDIANYKGQIWSIYEIQDFGPISVDYYIENGSSINDVCHDIAKRVNYTYLGSEQFGHTDKKTCNFKDEFGDPIVLVIGPKHSQE